jgi:hypothetical protein
LRNSFRENRPLPAGVDRTLSTLRHSNFSMIGGGTYSSRHRRQE